jgi:hypothetical protein
VLERIHHAENSHYEENVQPLLRVSVHSDRIQLSSNEQKLTEVDVRTICSVWRTFKKIKISFVGEKEIGLRSVFTLADEVHVLSRPFSFKFHKHQTLGLITPIWVPDEEVLATLDEDAQTAILFLPPAGNVSAHIFKEFKAIPPTVLLFLKRLKRLEISIFPEREREPVHKIYTSSLTNDIATLTEVINGEMNTTSKHHYRVCSKSCRTAFNEEGVVHSDDINVILAFPLDQHDNPTEVTQPVHDFLPIGDFGFKVSKEWSGSESDDC